MALTLSALAAFAQDAMISPEAPTTIALPGGERVEQAGQPNKINSDQRWLGLYTTDALGQFGRGFPEYPGDNKVAISLTQEMLQPHLGSRVVGIRFGLCEPIGASRVFIIAADRYGNGKDIVSKKVDDTEKGWNTVMLDNPITITTKPGMEWMATTTSRRTPRRTASTPASAIPSLVWPKEQAVIRCSSTASAPVRPTARHGTSLTWATTTSASSSS